MPIKKKKNSKERDEIMINDCIRFFNFSKVYGLDGHKEF